MVSFVIVSKNVRDGIEHINKQCDMLHISSFDRTIVSKETSEKAPLTATIGISEIKLLQKKIYLKPMQGSDKAIIIQDASSITNEAQNALLKVLEEPPNHTYIYLLTHTLNALLPTILSRCTIIQVDQEKELTKEVKITLTNFLQELPAMPIGSKLHIAEIQGKQKQAAIEWLEYLLFMLRDLLTTLVQEDKKEQITFYMHVAKNAQQTYDSIQSTNVNIRLALEHMLLTT